MRRGRAVAPLIRLACQADRGSIEAIVRSAYGKYVPRMGREPMPMRDDYATLIDAQCVHVLDDDGVIKGVIVLMRETETLLLHNVAIVPEAQGTGLGRLLLTFAERAARDCGYGSIRLYTNEVMTENIALYTRIGYVETHRGDEKQFRRVYLSKTLS
jgi:GNAT superfamily N-acetyltransferase